MVVVIVIVVVIKKKQCNQFDELQPKWEGCIHSTGKRQHSPVTESLPSMTAAVDFNAFYVGGGWKTVRRTDSEGR